VGHAARGGGLLRASEPKPLHGLIWRTGALHLMPLQSTGGGGAVHRGAHGDGLRSEVRVVTLGGGGDGRNCAWWC
jgi:hypothetical protein